MVAIGAIVQWLNGVRMGIGPHRHQEPISSPVSIATVPGSALTAPGSIGAVSMYHQQGGRTHQPCFRGEADVSGWPSGSYHISLSSEAGLVGTTTLLVVH